MTDSTGWLEEAWTQREEVVYTTDFRALGPGIYPLTPDLFTRLGQREIDPRWLTIGAFESPPNEDRNNWVYVTSGLSNAWHDDSPNPDGWSGMGIEFLIQCTEQSPWALFLARSLAAYQLSLVAGCFGDRDPLEFWDRTGVGNSIDDAGSALKALLFVPSPSFGGPRQLLSGRFEYLQAVGITPEEHAYGKEHGFEALQSTLLAKAASPIIQASRGSVL